MWSVDIQMLFVYHCLFTDMSADYQQVLRLQLNMGWLSTDQISAFDFINLPLKWILPTYYYHYYYYGVIITALIIVCLILVLQYSPIHSPHISYYKTLKVIAHIKIKLPHDEADYFQLMLQNDTWYSDCSPLWSWAKQVALPKIIASNQGMYSI